MIKYKYPIPDTPEEWLVEIAKAYIDAKETIPFAPITEQEMTENDLYHIAPSVCLKFRGIKRTDIILKQATDAALTSYVANKDVNKEILSMPYLEFAFCYLGSHFGLDIIDENQVNEVMEYIERNQDILKQMIVSYEDN